MENGFFFQWIFLSKVIIFTKAQSFLLEIDLDNLESSMSSCILFSFQFSFSVQEEIHSAVVMPH